MPEHTSVRLPAVTLALVSASSMALEIVAGRALAPYVGMSLYTWTSVIAVVLAGFSGGHWLGGRLAEAAPGRALMLTGWAMVAAALTTGGAAFLLRWAAGPVISAGASTAAAASARQRPINPEVSQNSARVATASGIRK